MSTSGMRRWSLISDPSSTQFTFVIVALFALTGPATARQQAIGWFSSSVAFSTVAALARNCWMMNVSEAYP